MLPSLRTGEALIVGEAVHLPLRAIIRAPAKDRRPDSQDPVIYDPKSAKGWNGTRAVEDYARLVRLWRSEDPRNTDAKEEE